MTQTVPVQVWRDSHDEPAHSGEGITRCSDPDAGYFWVEVLMRGTSPMTSRVKARSIEQAVQFSMARHPNAVLVRPMEDQD